MRVADNPHKPGTDDHRAWEGLHVHSHRYWGMPEHVKATTRADERLAALKASLAHIDTAVDDLIDEMAHINDQPVEVIGLRSGYTTGGHFGSTLRTVFNGVDLSQYFTSVVLHLDPMPPPNPDYYHWLRGPSAWTTTIKFTVGPTS